MPDHAGVLSLNLTRGCGHRCPFCSVRAQPNYPGDEVLYLYRDSARIVAGELSQRRNLPAAVLVSPSGDPFPPLARVQSETAAVVDAIASNGVNVWLMTRGFIRPSAFRVMARHAKLVKVIAEITTLDRALQRQLEPLTAPPRTRIRQIGRLREAGINVQVGLEPLIPGLTDTPQNLTTLLQALAAVGVQQVTAGYMFLRKGIGEHLQQALASPQTAAEVLDAYANGPVLVSGSIAPARYLPKKYRQRGYAALMSLAAGLGISVRISATANPDFAGSRPSERRVVQATLPLFAEAGLRSN
jgi:DNA repair photolyase